eukprot:g43184.t1
MQLSNRRIEYRHRGTVVCRKMWMRIYGIGDQTMLRAKKLLKHQSRVTCRNSSPQTDEQDLIVCLLTRKFIDECETIADGAECEALEVVCWEIRLTFDRDMKDLKAVFLRIMDLKLHTEMPHERREQLQEILRGGGYIV